MIDQADTAEDFAEDESYGGARSAYGGKPAPTPPIVAVFNHKGGIAKTTTACNLAACWAAQGRRVLLIDLDAQGNTGMSFGMTRMPDVGVWDVMTQTLSLDDSCRPSPYPNLTLLPATPRLRTADLVLGRLEEGVDMLGPHLHDIAQDVVLIDCPPSFGLTALNALAAASAVIIPSRPDPFSHEGMVSTWAEISRLRRMPGMNLAKVAMLLTMYQSGTDQTEWIATARAEFGPLVCTDLVPMDEDVMGAAQLYMPAAVFSPDGLAGNAYRKAANELALRFGLWEVPADPDGPIDRDTLNTLRDWRSRHRELTKLGRTGGLWTGTTQGDDAPSAQNRAIPTWVKLLSLAVIAGLGGLIWMIWDALSTIR